jgi:hypothetical protein
MNDCECKTLPVVPECWINLKPPPPITSAHASNRDDMRRKAIQQKRVHDDLPPLSPDELEAEVKELGVKYDNPKKQDEIPKSLDSRFTGLTMPKNNVPPDIKPAVFARTLDELKRPLMNDVQEVLKTRYLCKGGGLLLVGPTGIGKSSLSMQMMISWALSKPLFGIQPARPITSLIIQAENDEGDMSEMRDGVFSGLNLTDEDRALASSKIFVVDENTRTSEEFFNETVKPMLREIEPDLLWIDTALSYLGGDNNSQQAVGAFLRNQLNPLLTEFNCAAVVVHHTNKPYTGNDRRKPVDSSYSAAGSAEWMNWARAVLTMKKTEVTTVFELKADKRGNRLGWKEADNTTTSYTKFIAHCKDPGTICWIDVEPELVDGPAKGNAVTGDAVLKHVPHRSPILKNTLLDICTKNGLGINKARNLLNELVADGTLYELHRRRKGCQAEKWLARSPRPAEINDEELFTMFITGILPREEPVKHSQESSSQLHGPLGPVKNSREEHEEGEDRHIIEAGTRAVEEQPGETPACPEVAQPGPPAASLN